MLHASTSAGLQLRAYDVATTARHRRGNAHNCQRHNLVARAMPPVQVSVVQVPVEHVHVD